MRKMEKSSETRRERYIERRGRVQAGLEPARSAAFDVDTLRDSFTPIN